MNSDNDLRAEDVALARDDVELLLLLHPLALRVVDDLVQLGHLGLKPIECIPRNIMNTRIAADIYVDVC